MKKIIGVILIGFIGAGIYIYLSTGRAAGRVVSVQVNQVQGDVEVSTQGKSRQVSAGDSLAEGTVLEVSDGSIDLGLYDRGAVRLNDFSRGEIQRSRLVDYGDTRLQTFAIDLTSGDLIANFKSISGREITLNVADQIQLKDIEGSRFVVSRNLNQTVDVSVSNGQLVLVKANGEQHPIKANQQGTMDLDSLQLTMRDINKRESDLLQQVNLINFQVVLEASKTMISASEQQAIKRGLDYHKAQNGRYPEGLQQAVGNTRDPWGNQYNYRVNDGGREYQLSSNGPDGKRGTADDIRLK